MSRGRAVKSRFWKVTGTWEGASRRPTRQAGAVTRPPAASHLRGAGVKARETHTSNLSPLGPGINHLLQEGGTERTSRGAWTHKAQTTWLFYIQELHRVNASHFHGPTCATSSLSPPLTLKGSYTMIKWGLFQECKDSKPSPSASPLYPPGCSSSLGTHAHTTPPPQPGCSSSRTHVARDKDPLLDQTLLSLS